MKRIHIITDYGVEGWIPVYRWHAAARMLGRNAVLFFAVIGVCWTVASMLWP